MQIFKDTLAGKVALVTGAGSGIGKATAKLFAYAGAKVGVLTRTEEEADATRDEIESAGHEALCLHADISREDEMRESVSRIEKAWGRLDIVIANAGINGVWTGIEDMDLAEWRKTIDINLTGTFITIQQSKPLMRRTGGGAIVIVSSVNGTRMFSNTGATAYSATKAGQAAMARMLALEFGRDRIRVNTICPGSIETDIDENTQNRGTEKLRLPVEFPQGRIPLTGNTPGTAGQVAELAWFLSSDLSNHITGTEVFIDGAQSLLQG
ncbi:MAG: SDR family oxidoreductase [Opitutaceae bacterium]